MKNFLIIVLLLSTIVLAILLYYANQEKCKMGLNQPLKETIPLKEAITCTARYRKVCDSLKLGGAVQAFTVRGIDALQAMDMGGYIPKNADVFADTTAVRVYLGLDSAHNFKLFMVDVDGASFSKKIAGTDRFFNESGVTAAGGGSLVLDVNNPCPNTCDSGSKLMK
jgi:hypothetical protein